MKVEVITSNLELVTFDDSQIASAKRPVEEAPYSVLDLPYVPLSAGLPIVKLDSGKSHECLAIRTRDADGSIIDMLYGKGTWDELTALALAREAV